MLKLFDISSQICDVSFNENKIEGNMTQVHSHSQEDLLLYMCHVAECITFKKTFNFDEVYIEYLRERVVYIILSFLNNV